ncbi:MAG: DUF2075 domain-containing protein [Lachnospiraceae bacterium]|nr:DUF2075 domain-containing protein [Lachnospiraceae bacterium]
MIIYEDTVERFSEDVVLNRISDKILTSLKKSHLAGGSESEINSWNNSLHFMKDVIDTPEISRSCKVAVEYNIPQTSKRVDFMILGRDKRGKDHVVIVELKQWAKVAKVNDSFRHSVISDLRNRGPVAHPSYQAYSYKKLLLNYGSADSVPPEALQPCAYLHNMSEEYRSVLENEIYSDWVKEAPVFLKADVLKLRRFICEYISHKSTDDELLYKLDYGRIKPTKSLQDSIDSMLCGNEEFEMIDEQAVAYDYIMNAIRLAQNDDRKHVLIIQGGPGTGKSVLAVNVLADSISKLELNASYITKNSAPRNCYQALLAKGDARKMVDLKLAFRSPHSLPGIPVNGIDVGIFDEAHRMQKKPYMYKGDDMLKDAIMASRVSVFFVDDDQRITVNDCYDVNAIQQYARELGASLDTEQPFILESQFRCNGSDGYAAFVDDLLELRETVNKDISANDYDFRVFDKPEAMKEALRLYNNLRNKSRMCAGYCYDWNVKNHRGDWDIVIEGFRAKWNLENDNIFAVNPESFEQVGCIHTVQGMEFDYVGVIIGKDLIYRDGHVITDKTAISKDDHTSKIRQCRNTALADRLIRNTYKVLLTRGQKGCFVYCEDERLREYMKERIADRGIDIRPL